MTWEEAKHQSGSSAQLFHCILSENIRWKSVKTTGWELQYAFCHLEVLSWQRRDRKSSRVTYYLPTEDVCSFFPLIHTPLIFPHVCCVTLFAVTAPPGAAFKTFRSSCGSSLLLYVAFTALCCLYVLLSLSNSSNSGSRRAYFKMVRMRITWSLGCLESS